MGMVELMDKLLVILGPTATGKTKLGLKLAKKFNGEIVSCDSRQVYTGLNIGTGKLPNGVQISNIRKGSGWWEIDGIKIWMYDVVDPWKQYTVADYVKDANRVIREIKERGKLPIIVGGTGLYLKAILYGLSNLTVPVDEKLRKKLEKLTKEDLQKKLKETSSNKWEKLNNSDRENPRRLIRAIELSIIPKKRLKNYDSTNKKEILKIGLMAPKDILFRKTDEGVISRINKGIIEETKKMHKKGLSFERMKQLGLEYGVLADFIKGQIKDIHGDRGLIKIMQNKIHGFVRRQLTWFKKEKGVNWFNITVPGFEGKLEKLISDWYNQPDVTAKN